METQTNINNQNLEPNLNQSSKNPYKILFFVFLALFLIISTAFITTLIIQNKSQSNQQTNIQETQLTSTQSATSEVADTEISPTTSNLKTYKNNEIGFSFQYPATLGDFTFTTSPGDTGNEFSGKFSKNSNTYFSGLGGISTNFTLGRGGSFFTVFSGYSNKNNQIYFFGAGTRTLDKSSLIDPSAIKKIYKNKNGVEIVLINGYTFEQEDDMTLSLPFGLGKGNIGALVNTNNKTYPGIAFQFPKTLESDLTTILDSLEIN